MKIRFLLLSLFILSFSGAAFAQTHYWMTPKNAWPFTMPNGDKKVASPDIACYYSTPSYPSSRAEYVSDDHYQCYIDGHGIVTSAERYTCPSGTLFDSDAGECLESDDPEEPKCEAGLELSRYFPAYKSESGFVYTNAPNPGCFGGCRYNNFLSAGNGGCVVGGETGLMCMENYISDGTECEVGDGGGDGGGGDGGGGDGDGEGGGGDGPGEDDPDGDPDPNCRRFTNADGSWGYDCSPRPDPDENNECPPGYQMQGNTCFRIPPDHPDYDPDKDPQKPGDGGDGDTDPTKPGTGGDGDLKGVAQEATLKSIDKTLKDIDGSIKSGNSTTHSLLQGIKDAIGNIPGGGGGGPRPGTGGGDGDGDGEGGLTKPEGGSFDEAIAEQDEAIEGFKEELKTKFNQFKEYQIEGLTLSGGGGSLPSVTVSFGIFGTHTLDFGQYAEPLSNLGGIFVFMCGLLAVLIIFVRG